MNLSTLIGSGANPYLEFGWVTAPTTAPQPLTSNAVTTLTVDTKLADTGNFGSVASNQITLAAGTYYFEGNCPMVNTSGGWSSYILSLRKNVTTTPVIVSSSTASWVVSGVATGLKGQITIGSSTIFDMTVIVYGSSYVTEHRSGVYNTLFTLGTAGADQRATLKLWKLA